MARGFATDQALLPYRRAAAARERRGVPRHIQYSRNTRRQERRGPALGRLTPRARILRFLELAAFNRGTLVKNGSILHDKHDLPQGMNVREWVSADGN